MTEAEIQAEEALRDRVREERALQREISNNQKAAGKALADSLVGLAGSLNNGTQGMAAYNGVIGAGAAAFKSVTDDLGALGKSLGFAAGAAGAYVSLVNKQTDALYKSYQDISTVGASGKQGMQGVFDTLQQFGLGIAELPKFNALVKESAASLADFGGTVGQGLKAFANLTEGIQRTGLQTELLNMGLSVDSINKGLGGFLKTTTMLGNSTRLLNMTTEQQSKAASDYIKEQDKITKLTGLSAEQQQKSLEAALSNDRFAADRYLKQQKLAELEASGQTEAAAQLQAQLNKEDEIRNKYTGSMQQGYLDFVAGAGAQTEAGRAFMNAVGQRGLDALRDPMKDSAAALTEANAGVAAQLKQFGPTIIAAGKLEFLPAVKDMMVAAGSKINEMSAVAAVGQQKGQIQNPELALANYNAMIQKQQDITRGFQNLIQVGMQPLAIAMNKASGVILGMTNAMPGSKGMPREIRDLEKSGNTIRVNPSQLYINKKEQSERGTTDLLNERNSQSDVLDTRLKEGIKKDFFKDIDGVKNFFSGLADNVADISIAGTRVGDAARSAGDAVSSTSRSIVSEFNRMRDQLNQVAPSLRTPSSGQTANLAAGQVAAMNVGPQTAAGREFMNSTSTEERMKKMQADMRINMQQFGPTITAAGKLNFLPSMTSLLSEMRKDTGPNNNYNPSLTNATYTPPINREEETAKTNATSAAEQYNREQVMAYNNMSAKLDEMIGLLSRSVGIQDKTLRVASNA